MRNDRNNSPYMTRARFAGQCPETLQPIRKGDTIAYYPATQTAYHEKSKAAESVRGLEFAGAYGMADANY